MEEHRLDKGHRPDGGQAARQSGGNEREADNLRDRPCGARPALCDRFHEAEESTRMGAEPSVRRGHRKNRPLVPRQSGVVG